jgi:hypothetical protein
MKRPYQLLACTAIGMIIGGSGVGMYQAYTFRRISNDLILTAARGRVLEGVSTLAALRRDGSKAVLTSKEIALSEDIATLTVGFPKEIHSDEMTTKTLRMVAKYRADHPFKTGQAEVDHVVEGTLKQFELPAR